MQLQNGDWIMVSIFTELECELYPLFSSQSLILNGGSMWLFDFMDMFYVAGCLCAVCDMCVCTPF